MGQRFEKKYITGTFEYSKSMHSDTALQGLLGRSCGYHQYNYPIYMPPHIITQTVPEFIEFIKTRGNTGISNAMNTKSIKVDSPNNYPNTNGKEIFSLRMSPADTSHLKIHVNLKHIGCDWYGGIYELI